MNKNQNTINCPICNGIQVEIIDNYRNSHPSFSSLIRVNCKDCEMVFANPMPSDNALENFNANYFDSAHGGLAQSMQATAFFKAIARIRGAHLQKYIDKLNIKLKSILEIGPGPGFFAANWLLKNPDIDYKVMETDTSCYDSLNTIGVKILNPKEEFEQVEAVVISHVLEHVSNPKEFLKTVTQNLKVGGILFIEVPCKDYEHKDLDEPHLLFFDKSPMKLLLTDLKFDRIQVSYHGREIIDLQRKSFFKKLKSYSRSKLMSMGLFKLFSKMEIGLESVFDPLERASVKPFKAHLENEHPSWWLRAIAVKGSTN
jgi:SAM-dependent methyltransferase